MNIANVQLEGLYLAIAEILRLIVQKGVIERDELDETLQRAEVTAMNDDRGGTLSPAERDAMAFSIRLLRAANKTSEASSPLPFSELARTVGETKTRNSDQS